MRLFSNLSTFSLVAISTLFPSNALSRVLVTGASGKTGQLVFDLLLKDPKYQAKALVRSAKSGKKLRKAVKVDLDQIIVCDVNSLSDDEEPPAGLDGCESMIICTSAVPAVSKMSLVKAFLKIPLNLIRRKKIIDFRSFKFVWKYGGFPETVDYAGQIKQINLAKRLNMKQVIIVSSMGGTDPSNFLNMIGKNPDGSGNGDILLWKRKAERYLTESGLDYTIIHPGGLTDKPAGIENFVLDVDDKLLKNEKRSISRGDVASLCVAALSVGAGKKLSLDCITRPSEEEGAPVTSAEDALSAFVKEAKVYNYAL
jgi:uncharacterized protein YbjT (DUF2867 family)